MLTTPLRLMKLVAPNSQSRLATRMKSAITSALKLFASQETRFDPLDMIVLFPLLALRDTGNNKLFT